MSSSADALAFIALPEQRKPDPRVRKTSEPETLNEDGNAPVVGAPRRRFLGESMYTKMLTDMVNTVIDHECHLLSSEELDMIERLQSLPYASRYILIRLALRSRGKLHRLTDLQAKYGLDLESEDLVACIDNLCATQTHPLRDPHVSHASLPPMISHDNASSSIPPFAGFAEDEREASIEDMLASLKGDELKVIGTRMKVFKPGMKREEIIKAMLSHASKQATLDSFLTPAPRSLTSSLTGSSGSSRHNFIDLCPSPPPLKPVTAQTRRLRSMIITLEPRFIRLLPHTITLLLRLNTLYFRITSLASTPLLLPLILSRKKNGRTYPFYKFVRTKEIFPTREHLIRYEEALQMEEKLDEEIDDDKDQGLETRVERAERVVQVMESIIGRWRELCKEYEGAGGVYRRPGLERFEEGHVLTRIIYKGTEALGQLKRYNEEAQVLRELVAQKRWRSARRGGWYDRLALVLMHYISKEDKSARKSARVVLYDALKDPLTHMVSHPHLEKRLARVEKQLKIPEDSLYTPPSNTHPLHECERRTIQGTRLASKFDKRLDDNGEEGSLNAYFAKANQWTEEGIIMAKIEKDMNGGGHARGHHSVWRGEGGKEVGVEEFALEWYAMKGFKGFHSEGRLPHHLFAMLFWSILFATVPGAFETPFQLAPLDLGHDSFYTTRRDAIEARLKEIEEGKASSILEEIDDRERERNTSAIGVKWDLYSKEDCMEIVECIKPNALAAICRVICEDYTQRAGGLPDLFLWNYTNREAKFVEVKGPNDRLMKTQEVWIDVLLRAGMDVEVCHVEDPTKPALPKKKFKSKSVTPMGVKSASKPGPSRQRVKGKTKEEPKSLSRSPSARTGIGETKANEDDEDHHPDIPKESETVKLPFKRRADFSASPRLTRIPSAATAKPRVAPKCPERGSKEDAIVISDSDEENQPSASFSRPSSRKTPQPARTSIKVPPSSQYRPQSSTFDPLTPPPSSQRPSSRNPLPPMPSSVANASSSRLRRAYNTTWPPSHASPQFPTTLPSSPPSTPSPLGSQEGSTRSLKRARSVYEIETSAISARSAPASKRKSL